MRFIRPLLVATALLVAGCGGSDDEDPYTLSFSTGSFDIGTGDIFECHYTDVITDRELAVSGATGTQRIGGHHITVYYTELVRDPQHHPCDDAEMADWRMIGAAGGTDGETADDDLALPEGLGMRIPAGVQIVLQTHYINLTDAEQTVQDEVTLHLAAPETLSAFVNQFVVLDVGFNVPAGEFGESVTTCTVPQDVNLVRLVGHEHEWGRYYGLERIDEVGNTIDMLYEEDWVPEFASNPPIKQYATDAPLTLKAGTRLRQTCRWANSEDYDLIFPREMCLSFGLYYPDAGEIYCDNDPT